MAESTTASAPASTGTLVYELLNGGRTSWHRVGVFSTIENAKRAAALILDTYHEFDDDEDTEGVNYNAPWIMKRETIGRGEREVGDPKPFRIYGDDGSAFKIDTIHIDMARHLNGVLPITEAGDGDE